MAGRRHQRHARAVDGQCGDQCGAQTLQYLLGRAGPAGRIGEDLEEDLPYSR